LTWTTTLGGKAGWSPASRDFLQAVEAFAKETPPPFADDLSRGVQARGDLVVR